MVKEGIIVSTKTISSEEELNNIFRIENESIVSNENSNICSYNKNIIESPNDYEIRETIFGGLIDIETWNKIKQFERDNPDKIRKWREEDEEKTTNNYMQSKNCFNNHKTENTTKKISKTEQLIKDCMEYEPKNSFVLSVKSQFEIKSYISKKQMAILERILDKVRIREDL